MSSLNEIHESSFESSCTQVKTCGSGNGGVTDFKPVYPPLSSGDTRVVTKINGHGDKRSSEMLT